MASMSAAVSGPPNAAVTSSGVPANAAGSKAKRATTGSLPANFSARATIPPRAIALAPIVACLTCRDLGTKDEVDGAEQAEAGPEEVQLHLLIHVEHRERHEHRQRDRLLEDLQLRQRQHGIADAIRGNLQHVLEKGNAPAEEDCHHERTRAQVAQMRVPGKRH